MWTKVGDSRPMEFMFNFIRVFASALIALSPLLLLFAAVITMLGVILGRIERWNMLDSVYFAFITATTVGYGDIKPSHSISKIVAILIALVGIVLTGIFVAIGLYAVESAISDLRLSQ